VLSVVNIEEAAVIGVDINKILRAENPSRVEKLNKRQSVLPAKEGATESKAETQMPE
jgi:hypothetical protein